MRNFNIYEKIKWFFESETVKIKTYRSVFFPALFFIIIFISTVSLFFMYPQNKLHAENNEDNGFYSASAKSINKAPFIFPLDGEIILGFREDYFYDEKKISRKHTGIDIKGKFNQAVFSSGNGIVSFVGFSPTGGMTIAIRHNEKIRTTYLNMLNIFVTRGDYVHQWDVIGTIGGNDDPSSLGESYLHFGVIYDEFYLDPEDVLKIDYKNITSYISLEYIKDDFYIK